MENTILFNQNSQSKNNLQRIQDEKMESKIRFDERTKKVKF